MKIREEINTQIKEELAISDQVRDIANSIVSQILRAIKNNDTEGLIPFKFNERVFKFEWKLFNFKNKKDFQEDGKRNISVIKGYNPVIKRITMPVIRISGFIDKGEFADSVYHEIEHAYQEDCGEDYTKNAMNYIKIKDTINRNNTTNEIKNIGKLLYFSDKNEIDAFVNGMYGEVSQTLKRGPGNRMFWKWFDEVITKTECYGFYRELSNGLNKLLRNGISLEATEFFKKMGIRPLKDITNGKKYFLNKMGKVIVKLRKDYFENNPIMECPIYDIDNYDFNDKYFLKNG